MNNIDNTIKNIGHKIKYYRNLNKVSLSKLAKEANISKSTLFGLEEGRSNPTISTLINISKTLNIELTELIGSNKRSTTVALSSISNNNNKHILKLSLLANQTFILNEDIYSDIKITVLDGELLYIDKEKRILENQTLTINYNAKLKAQKEGVTAIIYITQNNSFNYIKEDIFIDKATTDKLEALENIAQSSKISRVICSSIYPVQQPAKIENIQIFEVLEEKELHYYFVSTLLGTIGGATSVLNKLELKPTKQIINILSFIKKANTLEMLSQSDFQNIPKNPIEFLIDEIKKLIIEKYNNCNLLTNACKLSTLECKSSTYILIIDELINNIEQAQNLIKNTILIDIYRAVELLIPLKEQELTSEELEFYLTIREKLSKALYFAKNNYTSLAIKQIKQLTDTPKNITSDSSTIQLYIEALNLALKIPNNKESLKTYTLKTTLEQKINDLNLELIAKVNLHPSIDNSGKYLYLLKCNR